MKAITLRLSDTDHAALVARAAEKRYSAARYLLALMDADLHASAAPVSTRKLSVKDQALADYQSKPVMDRPFVRHLVTHRGFATECLQPMTKEAVHTIYTDFVWAGPDGTLNGSYAMSIDERATDQAVFNLTTGQNPNVGKPQPPITFDAPASVKVAPSEVQTSLDENGDLNFED